jgi:predicted transcriptional regulator
MVAGLGVKDALVEQPGVQLIVVRDPQTRHKQPLADVADLVLDLPFLPAGRWRARDRLD